MGDSDKPLTRNIQREPVDPAPNALPRGKGRMILLYLYDVMYKMKTWKQKFLVMVYIYISLLMAFRYRGKGHLAYDMRILHGLYSLALSFQLSSIKGWAGPFMITLTMPRQSNWNATGRGLRAYDRSGWSVTHT